MIIEVYKCDNKNCGHVAENMEKVSLGGKEYDLCKRCISILSRIVETGFDVSSEINPCNSEPNILSLKHKNLNEAPPASKEEKEDLSASKEEKEDLSASKEENMMSRLDRIGRDVIAHDCIARGLTITQLAMKYNIPKPSMAGYLRTRKIRKSKQHKPEIEKCTYNKYSIDKLRSNPAFVGMLSGMEESSSDCNKCLSCAYRDTEINHCWYTVATNKENHLHNGTCDHYVNIKDALSKWK